MSRVKLGISGAGLSSDTRLHHHQCMTETDRKPNTKRTATLSPASPRRFAPQIVVSPLNIERYERTSANGSLVQHDQTDDGVSPYAGITAVASDSSGNWLVSESLKLGRRQCSTFVRSTATFHRVLLSSSLDLLYYQAELQ